jgi:DNA replication protein DnaC
MPVDDVAQSLRALGLRASAEALSALLTHATTQRLSPVEYCEQLVVLERRERDAANLARRSRNATLGSYAPLDTFDWAHPRSINRDLYDALLGLGFGERAQNVLFRGPSGVGKTMLAQNLGLKALQEGYTVRYSTLATALADLLKQESLPALERRLKHYTTPDLLILDELGYLPCDSRAADVFYNIISRRHEQRSTIITTNLAFKSWGTIFPGAACVGALVDRFTQHCLVMDIDADSWRQKTLPTSAQPPVPTGRRRKRR